MQVQVFKTILLLKQKYGFFWLAVKAGTGIAVTCRTALLLIESSPWGCRLPPVGQGKASGTDLWKLLVVPHLSYAKEHIEGDCQSFTYTSRRRPFENPDANPAYTSTNSGLLHASTRAQVLGMCTHSSSKAFCFATHMHNVNKSKY